MVQHLAFWIALAVGVPVYWALAERHRAAFLAALSAGVLGLDAPGVVAGLGLGAALAWRLLHARPTRPRAAFVLGAALLAQLALFKYLPPVLPDALDDPVMPLGLSFYTFKLLHYCIEAARGKLPTHRLSDGLAWVFLFPAFTAGPIERFDHFVAETRPRWSAEETVEGLWRIAVGLVKRFVLAELVLGSLYKSTDAAELLERLGAIPPWWAALWLARAFVRLYLDFSGYSDIAVGASLLFGRRIVENFDSPLLSRSPAQFWQRWHISLARWCAAYVYMPVLGLTRRPYVAVYVTFVVIGLWHAGSAHWLVWGLWQGTGVAASMALGRVAKRRGWAWSEAWPTRLGGIVVTFAWMTTAQAFSAFHGVAPLAESFRLLGYILGIR